MATSSKGKKFKIDPKEVFICYRGSNDAAISVGIELYYLLEKLGGVSCFFAPRTIPKGYNFKDDLPEYFSNVKVVVLLLTGGFFDKCGDYDDVVYAELVEAFKNRRIKFLPIQFPSFAYSDYEKALTFFNERDINKFKHINSIEYKGAYNTDIQGVVDNVIKLKDTPIENDIRTELMGVGDNDEDRKFETNITNLAVEYSSDPKSEEALFSILDEDEDERAAYYAYYCLNAMYRRNKDFYKLGALIENYKERFKERSTANHLIALYYLESGAACDYDELLENSYEDARRFSDNAGYGHLFADMFATIYENGELSDKKAFCDKWHDIALEECEHAIELTPSYAKFYCTKARILAIDRRFREAEQNINRAISLENSRRNDYYLRIGNYQYYKGMIKTEQKLWELYHMDRKEESNV